MRGIVLFSGLLFILTLISCQKKRANYSEESKITQATHYIDEQNYNLAIQLLESELSNKSASDKIYIVLASAYAGRAGLRVENYWDYLIGFKALAKNKSEESAPEIIPATFMTGDLSPQIKKFILNLNIQYRDLYAFERKVVQIPAILSSGREDLLRARALLAEVRTSSAALYRSMLTAVLIKSDVSEGKKLIGLWANSDFDICHSVTIQIRDWLLNTMDLLSDGLNDMALAYPDDNEDYLKLRQDVDRGIEQLKVDILCAAKE